MPRKQVPVFETENEIFPTRLRTLMEEHGTTQERIAKLLGVKRQTVSLYKSGQSKPDVDQLAQIALYFGVTSDWLIGISDCRKAENEQTLAKDIGLSEKAIEVLREHYEEFGEVYLIGTVNFLIEQEKRVPDGYCIDVYKDESSESFAARDKEINALFMKDYEKWVSMHYVPVLSRIEAYLSVSEDSQTLYQITEGGKVLPKKEGGGLKSIRLDAVRTIPASDIVERVLLSDVEDRLKKLKKKYSGLEIDYEINE